MPSLSSPEVPAAAADLAQVETLWHTALSLIDQGDAVGANVEVEKATQIIEAMAERAVSSDHARDRAEQLQDFVDRLSGLHESLMSRIQEEMTRVEHSLRHCREGHRTLRAYATPDDVPAHINELG